MLETLSILAAATAEAAPKAGLVGQFGIDLKLIVAQAINFIVVAYVIWRFAYKPVIAALDERQRKIAEGLQFAEEAKLQLAETERRQAEVLREANLKAQEIFHEARQNARAFEERMKSETSFQLDEMRQRAESANEVHRQKMLTDVRQEVARFVIEIASRVLRRELGSEEKARLDKAAATEIARSH